MLCVKLPYQDKVIMSLLRSFFSEMTLGKFDEVLHMNFMKYEKFVILG